MVAAPNSNTYRLSGECECSSCVRIRRERSSALWWAIAAAGLAASIIGGLLS